MCDDDLRKEMDTVCRESLEDIQFLKQQQWKVVYYCLLLFGVLFFLIRFFIYDYNNPLIYYKTKSQWILTVISSVITFFGLYFQIDFQRTIQKNRTRIGEIRYKYFRYETKKLFDLTNEEKVKKYGLFFRGWEYLFIFYFTILVGFGLLVFMIWGSFILVFLSMLTLFFAPMIAYVVIAYVYKDKIAAMVEKLEKKVGSFIKDLRKRYGVR